jgi:hypothetical protein
MLFTTLAFGLCASIYNPNTLAVGYISSGECVIQYIITEGVTARLNDHEVTTTILEGGAEVTVDELKFVIQGVKPV